MKRLLYIFVAIIALSSCQGSSTPTGEEPAVPNIKTYTVSSVSFDMVQIPAGEFSMGASQGDLLAVEADEKPVHRVTLSQFSIGKYEVTQALWKAVMGKNPSYFRGDNLPVEQVSWDDCQEFIAKLNTLTGQRFRLPTEAEWEYACRASTETSLYSGQNLEIIDKNNAPLLDEIAWYSGNCGQNYTAEAGCDMQNAYNISSWAGMQYPDAVGGTHAVGGKKPNAFGLYDMLGNVLEWCHDLDGAYTQEPQTDPKGPAEGSFRIKRGGSWLDTPKACRSSYRMVGLPNTNYKDLGLRLAM